MATLEEPAEQRDVAEQRHLGDRLLDTVADQATKHHGATVFGDHGVAQQPLGQGRADLVDVADRRRGDIGGLLVEVEADIRALGDLRGETQGQGDVLAFNGDVERVV